MKFARPKYPKLNESSHKEHERIHTEDKPFAWNRYDHEFKMQEEFKGHQSVHTEEKPFACYKCDHEFMTQEEFKEHERVHTE